MKRRLIRLVVLLVILAAAGGGWWYWKMRSATGRPSAGVTNVDRLFTVRRGELTMGLSQSGTVTSSRRHQLSLEANYGTKLLWIIDENSEVKKGDLLAQFETEALQTAIDDMKVKLDNLEKELLVMRENDRIKVRSDAADLRTAEDNLVQAREDMRKYRSYEYRKNRDSMELTVKSAQEKLTTATSEYNTLRTSPVEAKSNESEEEARKNREAELKVKQNAVNSAKNELKNARNSLKVFKRYDHPNSQRQKRNAVEQAELQLMRVKVSIESNSIQTSRNLDYQNTQIRNTTNELAKHEGYLEQMAIYAPADGIVVYGSDNDRRWGQLEIKLGMDIWRGMVLMTIPDMSNMIVEFDLAELYRSRVNAGDRVVITPDSLPYLKLHGTIESIATLPSNVVPWDTNSPKVYRSKITLDQQNPQLVNGMSVKIEIVTKVIENTIFVPIEAVFEEKSRFFVYRQDLSGPSEVDVEIGESNDTYVQILSGLNEGDQVCLYRPFKLEK